MQPRQLLRSSNAARTLRLVGQQASAYVRLAAPPTSLPAYVNLDSTSDWLQAALLCTGVESVTLPTRLNAGSHKRASLSLLEDTLNTTDTQNLFEIHASITSSKAVANGSLNGSAKAQSNGRGETLGVDLPEPAWWDLDYTPSLNSSSSARPTHVFAQIECLRDPLESETRLLTMDPEERLRRRLNQESVVEV